MSTIIRISQYLKKAAEYETESDVLDVLLDTYGAYLNVLSRKPHDDELANAVDYLTKRKDERESAVIQFVWSLVASAEFRLNH